MKVFITGICGFVGSSLARELQERIENIEITGVDNLSRAGSEQNRHGLKSRGIRCWHGDIRNPSDLENFPRVDWVIDAAANPSVLAGVSGVTSSRQVMEHNLMGTVNCLEFCKRHSTGLIMLSSSRVYSEETLSKLPLRVENNGFVPRFETIHQPGFSPAGVNEDFSTQPPLSLYGSAKLASEIVSREYGHAFGFPVHVNRCGLLAGAGQFGKPDQGILSYWIHSFRWKRPLSYIGFGGSGHQVRDCLHPRDLAALVSAQMHRAGASGGVTNVGGGVPNSFSLAQLTSWCARRFGHHQVGVGAVSRPYDIPWLVLDSGRARTQWEWQPTMNLDTVLDEIAEHAEQNPHWLDLSSDA